MQHSEVNTLVLCQDNGDSSTDEAMTQGADSISAENNGHDTQNVDTPTYTITDNGATPETCQLDINGGIDDDDLLEMMSREVKDIHTTTMEVQSQVGPLGSNEELC